ncbi:MAG: NifB/NifX family molybdenum-iron cluster-binding protein [Desulfomonilaceae bacterium]|nr:NifB/NifX family molybdenum-iron cluster-binding protein [Desulfomonilaceae bacterium]
MKVAIPEHQGRVAPVFDTCRRVLIFSQNAEGAVPLGHEDWSDTGRHARPARLKELGVDMLLCGGISGWMEGQLGVQGIQTMPWLAGEVPEILEAFRLGRVTEPQYAMPGRAGFRGSRAQFLEKFSGWCRREQLPQGKDGCRGRSRKRRRNLPPG